jgi:hypothetical protein
MRDAIGMLGFVREYSKAALEAALGRHHLIESYFLKSKMQTPRYGG